MVLAVLGSARFSQRLSRVTETVLLDVQVIVFLLDGGTLA